MNGKKIYKRKWFDIKSEKAEEKTNQAELIMSWRDEYGKLY